MRSVIKRVSQSDVQNWRASNERRVYTRDKLACQLERTRAAAMAAAEEKSRIREEPSPRLVMLASPSVPPSTVVDWSSAVWASLKIGRPAIEGPPRPCERLGLNCCWSLCVYQCHVWQVNRVETALTTQLTSQTVSLCLLVLRSAEQEGAGRFNGSRSLVVRQKRSSSTTHSRPHII